MRQKLGFAVYLALAIIALAFLQPAAAQNPFAPPAGTEQQAEPPKEDPSLFSEAFRSMMALQRDMVRDIGRYMRDIKEGTSRSALWVGIGFAFLYGAVHAIGPGHGKMVVASYFVGHEADIKRGLLMGVQIAVIHVVSAIVLVSLVDIGFRHFLGGVPAESKTIRLVSYGLIIVIGLYMLYKAIANAMGKQVGHTHSHDHEHGHGHFHGHGRQGVLAFFAGLVPCTGAILVMLFALANDILIFGILLVIAISAGMALTMSTIGMLTVIFRRFIVQTAEKTSQAERPVAIALEHAGAILILFVGITFFWGTWTL